jgi:hypothetical protein
MPYTDPQQRKLYQRIYYLNRKKNQSTTKQNKSTLIPKSTSLKKYATYDIDFTNDRYDEDECDEDYCEKCDLPIDECRCCISKNNKNHKQINQKSKPSPPPPPFPPKRTNRPRKYRMTHDVVGYVEDDDDDDDDDDYIPSFIDTETKYAYYKDPLSYTKNPFLIKAQNDEPTFTEYMYNTTPRYITKMPYPKLVQRTLELSNKLEDDYEDEVDKTIEFSNKLFGERKSRQKTEYIYHELSKVVKRLSL